MLSTTTGMTDADSTTVTAESDTSTTDKATDATTMPGDTSDMTTADSTTMQDTTSESATTAAPENLEKTTMNPDEMTTADTSMTTMQDSEKPTDAATTPAGATEEMDTTMSSMSSTPASFNTPCPMLANLTDEQVVLLCPTGFKRHPKLCNLFYQCTSEGDMQIKILILQCPEGTLFDEKKIQCLPEAETDPCMGTISGKKLERRAIRNAVSVVS